MDTATLAYLKLLRNALRDKLVPALTTPIAQQTAKLSLGLFARILVQANQAPALRLQALSAYASVLNADVQVLNDPALRTRVARMTGSVADAVDLEALLSDVQVSLIDAGTPAAQDLHLVLRPEPGHGHDPQLRARSAGGRVENALRDRIVPIDRHVPAQPLHIACNARRAGASVIITIVI